MQNRIDNLKQIIMNNKKMISIITIVVSAFLLILGLSIKNFNMALGGILLTYIYCLAYSITNIKDKMYYFIFLGVIFVFILSRPTISMFRGDEWWYSTTENEIWTLSSIYISLIGLLIGGFFYDRFIKNKNTEKKEIGKIQTYINDNIKNISKISFVGFIISFIAKAIVEVNKYVFMIGKDYVEYYTLYENNLPGIITTLSGMMIVFLVIYLMTKPTKKMSLITLGMYIITTIPMLLIGERGSIIKALIFAFIYIWYRNSEDNETWITKKHKIIAVIAVPILIMGLGIYNYTRENKDVPNYNPLGIIVDFFYKQGVTFDVLNIGHGALEQLPNKEDKNYTFGGFIDYIKYNSITCALFNIEPLESGNNIRRATESNSFAHAVSYTTRADYLDGHRMGVILSIRIIC